MRPGEHEARALFKSEEYTQGEVQGSLPDSETSKN